MAGSGRKTADETLLLHLAAGLTVEAAAARAGVSTRTAHRRLADPDFRRRVAEARANMVQRSLGKLANASTAAARTLRKLLKAEADSVKLGAARSILELGSKLRETVELEQRLADVEQQLAERLQEKNKP